MPYLCGLPLPKTWILAAISTLVLAVRVNPSSVFSSPYERKRIGLGLEPTYRIHGGDDSPIHGRARDSFLKGNTLLLREFGNPPLLQGVGKGGAARYKAEVGGPFEVKEEFDPMDNQLGEVVDQDLLLPQVSDGGHYHKALPILDRREWNADDFSPVSPLQGPAPPQALLEAERNLDPWVKELSAQEENLEGDKNSKRISDHLEFRRKRGPNPIMCHFKICNLGRRRRARFSNPPRGWLF